MDNKLERIIGSLKSSEAENFEKLEGLEKELQKRKTYNYEGLLRKIDASESGRILEVIKKLNECFEYTDLGYNEEKCKSYDKQYIDLSAQQFDKILEISRIGGDVFSVLETLSHIGYYLKFNRNKRYVQPLDISIFKELAENSFSDEKKVALRYMKDMLGYTFCMIEEEYQKLITVAKMKGDVLGAVCLLANEGCKINSKTGLSKEYLKSMKGIAKELKKMERSGSNYSYMYEKVKPDIFMEYFSNLGIEKKKTALKKILESDYDNKEVAEWLEQNYHDLLREASFGD